jgi:16S rRNA (uracil1498-N3)-methyltransferase
MRKRAGGLSFIATMNLNPGCVNNGGEGSLILLEQVPEIETEVRLSPLNMEKLALWQARPGEIVTVGDPEGRFFRARLTAMAEGGGKAVVFQSLPQPPESFLRLDVYQALPEKERFELILQKLTEIGVCRIVPYVSQRSTTPEKRDAGQKKSHRWPEVLLRAAKQCRRGMIPELSATFSWDMAIEDAARADLVLVFSEHEKTLSLKGFWRKNKKCGHMGLFVGPEGGFSEAELTVLAAAGFVSVSLGARILRTETAAIIGAALIQSYWGDLG